jgi:hypothetical protein
MTIRHFPWASIAVVLLLLVSFDPQALVEGDARFIDVRTKLDRDHSGKRGDPTDKYFREISASAHEGYYANFPI